MTPAFVETDWLVVSQVKSYRVVYFTDDPDYVPPGQGDWYYVSPFRGSLPKGMTLRNCWRWRFNGHEFVDAGAAKPRQGVDPLLENNKDALRTLLREKIDTVRRPYAPSSVLGEQVREEKLQEARELIEQGMQPSSGGYLLAAAAARRCTVREMAQRVVDAHEAQARMLRETEALRESLTVSIDEARTQTELIDLRARLLEEVAPELNARFAVQPSHTTPRTIVAVPAADELAREQLRLRIQLRERVNGLRRPYVSHYLLDDLVLKHRARIAQAVLAAGGAMPPGLDGATLLSYAAARKQPLAEAAQDILSEMDEAAQVLLETEASKDAFLSRIAGVATFKDIEHVSAAIAKLELKASEPGKEGQRS
ncbi:hypothetical protein EJP67_10630 [Variovorax guangxiensis]|uniref:Uncharacterized protein n=1 Tax=Variovorax guangxiensis TaxID=1775474 RepID=A0A3S0XDT5_9BURK|nr:hypothetical protein [Variovorax guangxiensis]RUR67509.1 hypothetical protein EJP67_10630 [Variovorax guangxiensis]